MSEYGPTLPISKEIHEMKYRSEGETFEDSVNRQSSALADNDEHRKAYTDILLNQRFMPAGRVQSAIGSPKKVTPWNCLAGETEILTKEYGSVKIQDVSGQTVTLLDGNNEWVKCPIIHHGVKDVYDLRFTGGYESRTLGSTLDHGWIKSGGNFVARTKALNIYSKLRIEDLRPTKIVESVQEYEKGIIHGLVYGDGHRNEKGFCLRVCGDHEGLEEILDKYPKSYPESYSGEPIYYFFGSNAWCDFKELPNSFCSDYLLGFMRGWLAADGCVSQQPEATLCIGPEEEAWCRVWMPLVGWHPVGVTELSSETNYGVRNKQSRNLRLKTQSMESSDFLLRKHKQRWDEKKVYENVWRVHAPLTYRGREDVYCPVVPTTHSFALSCGIHSANCFLSGTVADSFDDIMQKVSEAGHTMRLGGGIGYDFSTLRPKGENIKSLGSQSSGPVSFMDIFNSVCGTVSSSGHRRGAQMAVMRVDHPDIREFVHAKRNSTRLTRFNISVGITDKFMEAVKNGDNFNLKWKGRVKDTIDARKLWDEIMRSTWDWSEPGVLFIDKVNRENNLWYCEEIAATNPCGEQPLPPYGACLLGSFNIVKYVDTEKWVVDKEKLKADVPYVVRAMDNIIDEGIYPLDKQREEGINKRRMGLGVTGIANALEACGFLYATDEYIARQNEILSIIRDEAYRQSVELAKEKGAFPLFDAEKYPQGKFIQKLPQDIQDAIKKHGIRNSHLTSVAPTGTISLSADNVSSGIEPVFTYCFERTIQTWDGPIFEEVSDYAYREWGVEGRKAQELDVEDHVKVLTAAQEYVDSACSKTCNVGDDVSWERFQDVYMQAYEGGAKGCTTFRAAGKRYGVLNEKSEEQLSREQEYVDDEDSVEACTIDLQTGQPTCS